MMQKYGFHQKRNKKSPTLRRVGLFSTLHKAGEIRPPSSAQAGAGSGPDEGPLSGLVSSYRTNQLIATPSQGVTDCPGIPHP